MKNCRLPTKKRAGNCAESVLQFACALLLLSVFSSHAQAQTQDLFRVQSFVTTQTTPPIDTAITRTSHQITAMRVYTPSSTDTLFLVNARFYKTPKDFIDTIQVFRDADSNGIYTAGTDVLIGNLTGTNSAAETVLYSLSPNRLLPTGGETVLINVTFKSNIANGDTVLIRFEDAAQPNPSVIRESDLTGRFIPRAATDDTFSLTYTARVDTVVVTESNLTNRTIHPDSRVMQNPLTIFHGTITGETRGFDTDFLTNIGIAFGGTARDSVYSAWALLGGRATDTIPLARLTPTSDTWALVGTLDSSLRTGNTETFLIRVRVADTTANGATLWAYVPSESVTTRIRNAGPFVRTDSSGIVTLVTPRTVVATDSLGNLAVHPDSFTGQAPVLMGRGRIDRDTLTTALTHDTIFSFAVAFDSTGAMLPAHIDSAYVAIVGTFGTDTYALARDGGRDSFFVAITKSITDSAYFRIYVITDSRTPQNATLTARIPADSITSSFRIAGPLSDTSFGRVVTFMRPRISVATDSLGNLTVHPDSFAGNVPVLMGSGRIDRDTLSAALSHDTIIRFAVAFDSTGAMLPAHLDSVYVAIVGDTGTDTYGLMRDGGRDSFFATITKNITDSAYFRIYVITDSRTPQNATLTARITADSIATRFRLDGPITDTSFARTVTFAKPQVVVSADSLGNLSIHPDSFAGSVPVLMGSGRIDTTSLSHDTITRFGVAFDSTGAMLPAHIDSAYVAIVGTSGTDTYALARDGGRDSFFAAITKGFADSVYFRIYVITDSRTPQNATLTARLTTDSISTTFRLSGPAADTSFARTVTFAKPQIVVSADSLGNITVHPDSFAGNVPVLVGRGRIDTTSLSHDTITRFGVSFDSTGAMLPAHIDSAYVAIVGTFGTDTYALARDGGRDSFFAVITKSMTDSAYFRIYVVTDSRTPQNATLRAKLTTDSLLTTFRLAGPATETSFARVITFARTRLSLDTTLTVTTIVSDTFHADTRVTSTAVTVLKGAIRATVDTVTHDTITTFGVNLAAGAGAAIATTASFESVALRLQSGPLDTTLTMTANGTTGLFRFNAYPLSIADTAVYTISVFPRSRQAVDTIIVAGISTDSIQTVFRDSGPAASSSDTAVITFRLPPIQETTTVLANDTVLPGFAFVTKFKAFEGVLGKDALLGATPDSITSLQIEIEGPAGDSAINVQFQFKATSNTWLSMVKSATRDTVWTISGIDSVYVTNDTFAIRMNIAETTALGETLAVRVSRRGIYPAISDSGPIVLVGSGVSESSAVFTVNADPLLLGMVVLLDTQIPPWQQLASNPTLVLEGTFYTDSGGAIMLAYDTLTRFGVTFETSHVDIRSSTDSILAVQLSLLANAVRVADTISLVQDSALGNGLRWKLPAGADTTIDTAQRFRVYMRVASSESLIYDTILASIPRDSVATQFTSAAAGDTHSSRIITYRYPDTALIVQDTTITDTNVNPDSAVGQNPFIIFRGSIRGQTNNPNGQQWLPAASDSLTYLAIDLHDNPSEAAADSITNVVAYLGPFDSPITLIKVGSVPGSPATIRITNWRAANLDSRLTAPNNTETFYVRATVADTIVLGTRIRARMFTDSIQTFFMADSANPSYEITGSRQVTFTRAAFSISSAALGDTTVSPFRVRNDSTLAFQGTIAGSETPRDSVIRFGIQLVGSSRFFGESVQVRIKFDTGPSGNVAFESTMVLVNANSTRPTFRLNDTFTVDSGQAFAVRVILLVDTPLIGETFTASMPLDSTAARYSAGGNTLLASGRTVLINYTDSLVITDSVLSSVTIHPSLVMAQNPFAAFVGRIGNRSGLSDSVQRIRIRFVGTAVGANDSVASVAAVLNAPGETIALARIDTVTWGFDLRDSNIAAGSSMACTIYVTISETVGSNTNLQATVPTDSISLLYSEDTALFTASRITTFNRGQMNITTTARTTTYPTSIQLGDTKEVMWFTAISGGQVEADTLHALYVRLVGATSAQVDTMFLVRDAGRNQRFDSAGALADTRVGTFVFEAGDTWRLVIAPAAQMITDTVAAGSKSDTAEYLVVLRLLTTATTCTSVRVTVPALGADGPFTDSGPAAAVTYDSYSVLAADTTPPLPPSFFTVTPSAGSFLIEWGPSQGGDDDMNGGQYNLYWDSAARQYPITVLTVKTHDTGLATYSFTISAGLVTDSEYRFRLTAQDRAGNEGTSAVITAISGTPSAQTAVMYQPGPGDRIVRSRTFTVFARIKDKTTATLVTGVRFDSRALSTSGNFAQVGSIVTDTIVDNNGEYYYAMTFDASTTAADSYDFRAVARTAAGFDTYPTSASIQLLLEADTKNATVVSYEGDSQNAADSAYLERVITDDRDVTLIVQSASGAFDCGLTLKAGAIGANDTARVVIDLRKDTTPAAALAALRLAGLLEPEYFVNISIISTSTRMNGETLLVGTGHTVVLSYIDNNNDFLDDSTGVDMRKATIYTITASGAIEALTTERNHTLKILYATITHFSPFFISNTQGQNTVGLNRLIVGPNPFRPNDGNDQTGKPFVAGDATTGIIFLNLPPNTKIEIYTIIGEKITELNNTATGASIAWSVKNDNNKDVATGYYLYVVTDPATGQRVTGKVAVIR